MKSEKISSIWRVGTIDKKVRMLVLLALSFLVLSFSTTAVSASVADTPQANSRYKQMVLILTMDQWKNSGGSGGSSSEKVYDYYELLGLAWDVDPTPEGNPDFYFPDGVPYVINPSNAPEEAHIEIFMASEAWDDSVEPELYNNVYTIDESAEPSTSLWQGPDFVNVFCWRRIRQSGVIAQASIWYDSKAVIGEAADYYGNPVTLYEIVDVDVIFSTGFKWGIYPDLPSDAMDVRNIATHEIGHSTGLDDLYDGIYSELTIYGYADYQETKKTSLEEGDISGAQSIYDIPYIVLTPSTATITAGENISYSVTYYDETGATDVTTDATYDIEPDAGGTWEANVYTSQNAGTWTVTATYQTPEQTLNDTAKLTVNLAPEVPTLYVKSIEAWTSGYGRWIRLYTKFSIIDETGRSVEGATVHARLNYTDPDTNKVTQYTASGDTGSDGTVTFVLSRAKDGHYVCWAEDVVKKGFQFDDTKGEPKIEFDVVNGKVVRAGEVLAAEAPSAIPADRYSQK